MGDAQTTQTSHQLSNPQPRSNRPITTTSTYLRRDEVIFQETEKAGIIILNNPKSLNAGNLLYIHGLTRQLEEFEKFKSHTVMKSAVPQVFSVGGNVVKISELIQTKDLTSLYYPRYGYRLIHIVATLKIPHVALVDGVSMGAGAGVSILAQYCVCTENADLAMPELKIGIIPDVGSSFYLSRLKNHLGFYLALTGARIKGYNNVLIGTATHYCESAKLPELEELLCTTDDVEATLNSFCSKPENFEFIFEHDIEKIDRIFSLQTVEEILTQLQVDGSPWAKKTVEILQYMCPLALKTTLHNLHLSKSLSLEECLRNEYILANTFFKGENVIEGVRAYLIDKDNKPKWNPRKLEDVTQQMIENLYQVEPFHGPLELRPIFRGKL